MAFRNDDHEPNARLPQAQTGEANVPHVVIDGVHSPKVAAIFLDLAKRVPESELLPRDDIRVPTRRRVLDVVRGSTLHPALASAGWICKRAVRMQLPTGVWGSWLGGSAPYRSRIHRFACIAVANSLKQRGNFPNITDALVRG